MADITGPISTMPGSRHNCATGAMCDDHPERQAVARVQGETDSFGSEMHDFCAECLAEHRKHLAEARCGECDWCKSAATDLRAKRDYDEGMSGPVYMVCGACVRRADESARQELEDSGFYDYDDCDD